MNETAAPESLAALLARVEQNLRGALSDEPTTVEIATHYHFQSGGKLTRALFTLGTALALSLS